VKSIGGVKVTPKTPADHFPQEWNDMTRGIDQQGIIIKGKIMYRIAFLPRDDLFDYRFGRAGFETFRKF
jgi:hypothetical protein